MLKFRDGLDQEDIQPHHYEKWYHEDRFKIGSRWTLHHGASFFRPSFKKGEGWELIYRDGDHVVMQNPDIRARMDKQHRHCFDCGYEDNLILAHDLRPQAAYRLNDDGLFVPDVVNGRITIVGAYPRFHVAMDGVPVYLTPDLNFSFQPQPDLLEAAKAGMMGSVLDKDPLPNREKLALRFCQKCNTSVIPYSAPKTQIYCSAACGHRPAAVKDVFNTFKCVSCGKDFKRKGPGNYRYCSTECADTTNKKQPVVITHYCQHCNKPFERSGPGKHTFCSDKCAKEKRAEDRLKRRIMRNGDGVGVCRTCGVSFHKSKDDNRHAFFCSIICEAVKKPIDRRK